MEVVVERGDVARVRADAVVVNLFEGVEAPGGATGAVDAALDGAVRRVVADGEFRGKLGETVVLHAFGGQLGAPRAIVVGLGKRDGFDLQRVRVAAAAAARAARKAGARHVASIAHGAGIGGLDPERAAQATVEGTLLGLYRFTELKTGPDDAQREVDRFSLVERNPAQLETIRRGAERGARYARATVFARDLGNRPANLMTPQALAEVAAEAARAVGLEFRAYDREGIVRLGMGAFAGVAQGSSQEPRFIVLRHRGARRSRVGPDAAGGGAAGREGSAADEGGRPDLALVGKALTFDSGGLSLKKAEGMEDMKFDMQGGAAVIAAMCLIAEEAIPLDVVGLVAATENMPGGAAQRPGDVVRAYNGKTIEVINTDAEGRLVLADAVAYAHALGAGRIVDAATLTGACVTALGHITTGLVANDPALAEQVIAAGRDAGERIWAFPADEEYKDPLRSEVADYKNTGGRPAGAIFGGLFIGEFAGGTPWAHLDIAGTAWTTKDTPLCSRGATGVGVRTFANLAKRLAEQG